MSTLDQRLAAQSGQAAAVTHDAALALSREVTRQQRQIVQELRTPVTVETPADRRARRRPDGDPAGPEKERPGAAPAAVGGMAAGGDGEAAGGNGAAAGARPAAPTATAADPPGRRVDVRI